MQSKKEEHLVNQIALGWLMLVVIVAVMLVMMLIQSALLDNNFKLIHEDPGPKGSRLIIYVFGLYLLMPLYTYLVDRFEVRVLKWVGAVLAALALAYFSLHHASHIQFGERPDFNSHVLDLAHHLVGLWLVFVSVRWARARGAAAV